MKMPRVSTVLQMAAAVAAAFYPFHLVFTGQNVLPGLIAIAVYWLILGFGALIYQKLKEK